MLSDGSLLVRAMRESVASVVCTVENSHGKDSIVYTVAVVRPPVAPTLRVSWLIISIHNINLTISISRSAESPRTPSPSPGVFLTTAGRWCRVNIFLLFSFATII